MSSSNIYTRKIMGLDISILFTMSAFILFSLGLMAYKVFNDRGTQPCPEFNIVITDISNIRRTAFNSGQTLLLKVPLLLGYKVIWNFGDETPTQSGFTVSHIYKKAGTFPVSAYINPTCGAAVVRLTIVNAPVTSIDSELTTQTIIGADETSVGVDEKFSTLFNAEFYEWSIENNNNYAVRYSKDAIFRFKTPGIYIVSLILDRNTQKKITKKIIVSSSNILDNSDAPKPDKPLIDDYIAPPKQEEKTVIQPPPANNSEVPITKTEVKPTPKIIKRIHEDTFKEYLQSFVCGRTNISVFDDYLCNGGATNVQVNDAQSFTPFSKLCSDIKDRKIKIDKVEIKRDENNCVVVIKVWYDKKGWIGKNPCNN